MATALYVGPTVRRTILALALVSASACADEPVTPPTSLADLVPEAAAAEPEPAPATKADRDKALIAAAIERTQHEVRYASGYIKLDYPGGDVPDEMGACTDLVIRSYRKIGIDLQVEVHEDMTAAFGEYPKHWGLDKPDSSIDHRRVPNLMTFFSRHGETKKRSDNPSDYAPGDIVTWNVGRNGKYVDHIGVVSNVLSPDQERYMMVHNIGAGPAMEDVMMRWPITGHYRYFPAE